MSHSGANSEQAFTGINVTPLTDVMLVLLITFLLTASSFESQSLSVPLPQVRETQQIEKNATVISVTKAGQIEWARPDWEGLSAAVAFEELLKESPHQILALAVHKGAKYSQLFPILQAASDAGWPEVILLTEETQSL